ncbi:putative GNAT family acetyltransferase [Dysgonomonas sp. PH5-45]|uniref:GNAT family N-acetyltransferase n=1 Tax=unclassified Dysgonomonas TaxID=2630389 RepID=UPI002473F558|nr:MULTISPECIES: GNAT family N-acetyltransferase [unclassified Dysgonomonas]MDH6354903.1 putative GNAT family acetyltransferase [Dysgonomonas sp. PH5-45]MDH6387802.1 putative GNAT family acetyltransferase [Dysgonomonas sp. PH5-37]
MIEYDVINNDLQSRFEAASDGQVIGLADYVLRGNNKVYITHTEVDDAYAGQGIAAKLTAALLDWIRQNGYRLGERPMCPYTAAYLERYPQYKDLL